MAAPTDREDRARLDGFELEIFKLVRDHADSEQWREWLRAPLDHAAATGDMDLFTRLTDAGGDVVGWRGFGGRSLLAAAVCSKSEEMVLAALEAAKDDVNAKFGSKWESALHVAAANGTENLFKALLQAGADPNGSDGIEERPLHRAAEAGNDGGLTMLLLNGADPEARTRNGGQTPLHLAAAGGHARCVSKLIAGGADKNSRNTFNETPLYLAAKYNSLRAVEELLAAGANADIRLEHLRYTALGIAANRGHVDVVRALVAHECSVSSSDRIGYTALHGAAFLGRDNGDVIRLLLQAGADIEAKTTDAGFTPLHAAAYTRTGSSGTIRALLEGGADVNSRLIYGETPLHYACSRSCVVAVELLLRWGADEKLRNEDGFAAEGGMGGWEIDYVDENAKEERKAEDQRIRGMLERAPADRAWRRRGRLVLARARPSGCSSHRTVMAVAVAAAVAAPPRQQRPTAAVIATGTETKRPIWHV